MKIEYSAYAIAIWGGLLEWSILDQNLVQTAYLLFVLAMLHTHEFAHARQCIRCNLPLDKIYFGWWGGAVIADIEQYPHDAAKIIRAGLFDTFLWAAFFITGIGVAYWMWWNGQLNLAPTNYIVTLWFSVAIVAAITFLSNIVPVKICETRFGLFATDGWASQFYSELSGEMWNRPAGEYQAIT